MDILICKIKYPNDKTGKVIPHQHFVAKLEEDSIELYSISSLRNKKHRIYDKSGVAKQNYYVFTDEEKEYCDFDIQSFINCGVSFKLKLDDKINIFKLSNRDIDEDIKERIFKKIEEVKARGQHTMYELDTEEFKKYNPLCIRRGLQMGM